MIEAWQNASLAREAADIARRDVGQEKTRILPGPFDNEPDHMPDLKELYYIVYSALRSERHEHGEIPPGVGQMIHHDYPGNLLPNW